MLLSIKTQIESAKISLYVKSMLIEGVLGFLDSPESQPEDCFCKIDSGLFTISDRDTTKLSIPLHNIINVVSENMILKVICYGQTVLLKAQAISDIQKWIIALLSDDDPPHVQLSDCIPLSILGTGHSGKVILVQKGKDAYALKSIPKKLHQKKTYSVLAERNILMRVQNPYIVKLFFTFQTASHFYLGLEYVPGGDLATYLTNNNLDDETTKLFTCEIAFALRYLHQIGVLYRDLKPHNILLTDDGHIKLTDFGTAKEISQTDEHTICGTCEYMAPEMITEKKYGFPIDWWALGVILYRIHTGTLPFFDNNQCKLFQQVIENEPDFGKVPIGPRDLIRKLMDKNPKTRIGDEILDDPYFAGVDWKAIETKTIESSFRPHQIAGEKFEEEEERAEPGIIVPNFSFCVDDSTY